MALRKEVRAFAAKEVLPGLCQSGMSGVSFPTRL